MKLFLRVLSAVLGVLYPVAMFTLLVVLKLPVRVLSLCVVAVAIALFLGSSIGRTSETSSKKKRAFNIKPLLSSALLVAVALACFFTNKAVFLKLYSVAVSAMLLFVFSSTLVSGPNIIFRFAILSDKSIKGSISEKQVEAYCRKVCVVWCIFFILNGGVALYTALFCSDAVWSVYNGGISYVLMGVLFVVEFIIRKQVDKRMPKICPISKFKVDSRPGDTVLCYDGTWSNGSYKTWHDFLEETAKARAFIRASETTKWIVHCEDYWFFLIIFVALLQCKKQVLLTQNISEAFIREIKTDGIGFFADCDTAQSLGAVDVPTLLSQTKLTEESEIYTAPAILSDETSILMYTSGSTGQPKAVLQRMTEFESDNAFVISQWGGEFLSRKLVSTVSQHHIYGFLFAISLPFSLGVPFRRKRIIYPEEFATLSDSEYMIIATPAFLKRTVEVEEKLPLKNCFIFTSGGVLTPEVAEKTNRVFGFWPMEVYGSTETSGIAYRQSKDGLMWTPFANAKIWKGDDGCLRIISPYIKDKEGFATADLVEILPDGRFLLLGRSDSIVKIEEKRISLTEVEKRILETGLVADVKVIALEDKRQYLAAALVFNKSGKEKFKDERKLIINRFFREYLSSYFEGVVIPRKWRFVDALPEDIQGKKHKEDIASLFATETED